MESTLHGHVILMTLQLGLEVCNEFFLRPFVITITITFVITTFEITLKQNEM